MKTCCSLFVLLCCVMISQAEGRCNCRDCSIGTQKCDSCQEGWFGKYCQKRNVALNRLAWQQGDYIERDTLFSASLAVDGNSNTDFRADSCSHSNFRKNAWWSVSLAGNRMHQIRYIKIYNRNDSIRNINRSKGMEILVNDLRCYKWDNDVIPPVVANVTCNETLIGDEVTIRIPADSLSLCEVQVFVCSDFWFGEDCDKQCKCRNSSEICDKITGQCKSECQPGLTESDCHDESPRKPTEDPPSTTTSGLLPGKIAAISVGLILAVLVAVFVVVLVLVCMKCRKEEALKRARVTYDVFDRSVETDHVYDNVGNRT